MESTSSFIKIIAGMALTLLVITFAFFIFNTVKGTGNAALTKATDTTNAMLESNITQYNRSDISGSEVVNAITTFMNSSEEIYIEVKTATGSDVTYIYPQKKITESSRDTNDTILKALTKAKEKGEASYISPKGKFTGTVQYLPNDDSVIIGILFEQH